MVAANPLPLAAFRGGTAPVETALGRPMSWPVGLPRSARRPVLSRRRGHTAAASRRVLTFSGDCSPRGLPLVPTASAGVGAEVAVSRRCEDVGSRGRVGGVEISFIVIVAPVHFHGRREAAALNPARHGARVNAAIALAD
jgi:hypothetical protein